MSEPSPKTRVVASDNSAEPPPWATALVSLLQSIEAQLASLHLGQAQPPALPTYPPQVSSTALRTLEGDPRLPDFLPPLVPLLLLDLDLTDEKAQELQLTRPFQAG